MLREESVAVGRSREEGRGWGDGKKREKMAGKEGAGRRIYE